uniref:MIA SH3 domain ER export factor 3 n=1 Tax=Hippocampus comes TaxID=109280 RepID=A0A3Q2XUF2_HIPCM
SFDKLAPRFHLLVLVCFLNCSYVVEKQWKISQDRTVGSLNSTFYLNVKQNSANSSCTSLSQVGSHFGYFPMDLLAVNHVYTDQEFEVPTEETDFVCFDTGFDQFDNYEIDSLLGFPTEESDDANEENSDETQVSEDTVKDTSRPEEEEEEEVVDDHVIGAEDIGMAPDNESASFFQLDVENQTQEEKVPDTEVRPDDTDNAADDQLNEQITTTDTFLEDAELEKHQTKDVHKEDVEESRLKYDLVSEHVTVSTSQGEKISGLETSFGSTFDAVSTDAESTTRVTPYEQEENEIFEGHSDQHSDTDQAKAMPLLSFSEEEDDTSVVTQDDKSKPDHEKVTSTPFDDDISAGSDTEWTGSEEVLEEEPESEPPTIFDEPQKDTTLEDVNTVLGDSPDSEFAHPKENEEPENLDAFHTGSLDSLSVDPRDQKEPETLYQIPTDSPNSLSVDPKETVVEELLFDLEDDGSALAIKHEETQAETPKPTDATVRTFDSISHTLPQAELHKKVTEARKTVPQEDSVANKETHENSILMEDKEDSKETLGENETQVHKEVITPETNRDVPPRAMQSIGSFSEPVNKAAEDGVSLQGAHQHNEAHVDDESVHADEKNTEMDEDKYEGSEDLLEDENALSLSQSYDANTENASPETGPHVTSSPEPVYSDSVLRLTLLQGYYTEEKMLRFQRFLGLRNLYKLESMFLDLDTELQATRLAHSGTVQDLEDALENILETSENTILDEIENILDSRHSTYDDEQRMDMIDEETEILDDFQELAFSLRQKYSAASDSTRLAEERTGINEQETDKEPDVPETETDTNHTVAEFVKQAAEIDKEAQDLLGEESTTPDISVGEDGGHFNKNKENCPSFSPSDEMQKFPQDTLESPLDKGLGEVERSSSGWLCFSFQAIEGIISLLPEEWKPGETLFGCPWQAVIITAVVGILTFTIFFWKTVLVKRRHTKNNLMKKKKTHYKLEIECVIFFFFYHSLSVSYKRSCLIDSANYFLKQMKKLEKSNEKLELSRKKVQEALTTVLLDEAKIREDAHSVQHKCLSKEYAGLKEENKNVRALLLTIREWEDKHTALSEQIKVYQKAQKELEDSVVLKDHNVEVLSELLADLDACELQKSDGKLLLNGEVAPDKKTAVKNRIKQMMDVSRVQTTLTVIEEERDRFMSKLLNEEKSRKALEEKHQELEHSIATLKSEKSHVENQFKVLQQKNEIMVEMYQQKENALQQRLTKEELERRSKENLLSEVGGKAVEAEEQVKVLRQRINEMEEQMKKTEEVYKEQVDSHGANAASSLHHPPPPPPPPTTDIHIFFVSSGGAPSPPLMIEGPRRPPSAPVGRRIDPYGEFSGLLCGLFFFPPPRLVIPPTSAFHDQHQHTRSPSQGPGSFLASPIRDSPGPIGQGPPPPGPGLHDPLFPPGPHGRLPPGGPYRPPRPPLYHPAAGPHGPPPNVPLPPPGPPLPSNGHPGMPLPGPMVGDFGPRPANGHSIHPRPGPGHIIDPLFPPPPPFRPPHHFGPMPHGMFCPF